MLGDPGGSAACVFQPLRQVGKPRARMRDVYIKERDFDVKSLKSVYRVATFFCEKYEVG